METAELDVALEELELRLERLRALYEQYFMGLEKIEPQIARKDVDRRIYVLRREKIRNTAKRFKLQTIIQRYNTFQQYWQRICREIENGTYKRHLLKAQKTTGLLTIAARKRLGRAGRASQPPEGATPSRPPANPSAPPSAPPPVVEAPAPQTAAAPAGAVAPPLRRAPLLPSRPLEAPAAAAPPAAPAPVPAPAPAPAPPPAVAAKPAPQPKPAPAKFESLDLDMDFMSDWDPGTSRGPAPKPAAPAAKPAVPVAKPVAAAPAPKPAAAAPAPKPAAAAPAPTPAAVAPAPKPLAPAPTPAANPAPARPASIGPAPVAAPPRPASSRPPTALLGLRTPPSPRIPAAPPPKPRPKPTPAATPAAMPAAAPAPAAPKPAAAAASGAGVDDARLRDLHTRLQQAKQQTKEANVSYEGLAKSIRAAEAKLREQHKNRKIDFDVVIKDGKAVVKPIVR